MTLFSLEGVDERKRLIEKDNKYDIAAAPSYGGIATRQAVDETTW